ncbi:MAG: HgcAB-associated protein HgcC [Thermoguttaceae bacterium]
MEKKKGKKCCQSPAAASYHIEAIISVDERGQMVLPKEARIKAGIQAGDKLALVGWRKGDRVCCYSLIKVEEMGEMLGELVSSLMAAAPESQE